MIRRSPEIEAIVQRWTELIRTHRVGNLPYMLSEEDALVYIGTADGELWRGKLVRDGISAHLAEVPDFDEHDTEIEAWENGETGWATYRGRFFFHGTGATGTHRATFVFVMEKGGWKLIQHHISQADSNMEKIGREHSAFADLIAAAQSEKPDFGTSGMATIMFTDIAGSTELAAAMGDAAWLPVLEAHLEQVAAQIEAQGGQLVKSLGDGTMSAFSTVRSALRAALAIQQSARNARLEPVLSVRIGLHAGDVLRARDDFFGSVVNMAARIAAEAAPGETLVSEAARLMVSGDPELRFAAARQVALKGFDGQHPVHPLEP
jgi:class 3 adenylate cyclase/ketosteroid isomerase-like protein